MEISRCCPSAARSRRPRPAFTLIELLVALVVSSLVVLGARALIEGIGNSAQRTHRAAVAASRSSNGDRLLRQVIGDMDIGSDLVHGFAGNESFTDFWSWCDVAAGWKERCAIRLELDTASHAHDLVMVTRTESTEPERRLMLRRFDAQVAFRYLNSASDGGVWFTVWGRGITAPLAIAIVSDRDTTILAIGPRG